MSISSNASHSNRRRQRTLFEAQLSAVSRLHHRGVGLLAGTDTFVPGFSLHDEFELFVRARLSPLEALSTATYNPAAFLGVADTFGTVQPSRVADLVVLNSDPTEDISSTRDIASVMLAGHHYDKTALAHLRTESWMRAAAPCALSSMHPKQGKPSRPNQDPASQRITFAAGPSGAFW